MDGSSRNYVPGGWVYYKWEKRRRRSDEGKCSNFWYKHQTKYLKYCRSTGYIHRGRAERSRGVSLAVSSVAKKGHVRSGCEESKKQQRKNNAAPPPSRRKKKEKEQLKYKEEEKIEKEKHKSQTKIDEKKNFEKMNFTTVTYKRNRSQTPDKNLNSLIHTHEKTFRQISPQNTRENCFFLKVKLCFNNNYKSAPSNVSL